MYKEVLLVKRNSPFLKRGAGGMRLIHFGRMRQTLRESFHAGYRDMRGHLDYLECGLSHVLKQPVRLPPSDWLLLVVCIQKFHGAFANLPAEVFPGCFALGNLPDILRGRTPRCENPGDNPFCDSESFRVGVRSALEEIYAAGQLAFAPVPGFPKNPGLLYSHELESF